MPQSDANVVLIHAIGNDGDCWQFMDLDAAGIPNAAKYVFPGHGDRERVPNYTLDALADDLVTRHAGTLDLIAMAAGGSVAQRVMVRHPERVRSALVACGGAASSGPATQAARDALVARGMAAVEGGMASVIDVTFARWFTRRGLLQEYPGVTYARQTLLAMDPHGWADIWRALALSEPVSEQSLMALEQPVSIVAGIRDASAGVHGAETLHRLVPRSRLEYRGGPHMLHLERPREMEQAIGQHFAWLELGGQRVEAPMFAAGE
jgi:3-oxoadipate enol-lactonase